MITMINWQIVFGHYSPLVWFCFVFFESLPKYINGCCLTLIDSQENENSNVWNSSLKIKTITLFSFFILKMLFLLQVLKRRRNIFITIWTCRYIYIYISHFSSGIMPIVILVQLWLAISALTFSVYFIEAN
jgi:hypothetical protein